MRAPFKPYIPQTIGELNERLGWMMIRSPTFKDPLGYFPDQNIETTFNSLHASLLHLRGKIGEDRYAAMQAMSDQMRAHFEADPEDKTEDSIAGRKILLEMMAMLRRKRAAPNQ